MKHLRQLQEKLSLIADIRTMTERWYSISLCRPDNTAGANGVKCVYGSVAHSEEIKLTTTKSTHGDAALLAEAIEKSPLSPDIEAYLESLELTESEKVEARESMKYLAGHFDAPSALPTVPPSIIRMTGWH